MLRALSSGISGLQGQQTRLDVIGNNIANANTIGFRGSRVNFLEMLSQTMSNGAAATNVLGSQNPAQVGLGVRVGAVDIATQSGSLENTGRATDMALSGNSMFILKDTTGGQVYTRAGSFNWDARGYLVNPATGQRVQGWMADANGKFTAQNAGTLADIQVNNGNMAAKASTQVTFSSNLDAGAAVGTTYTTPTTVFDSQGRAWTTQVSFKKTAANSWDWAATDPSVAGTTYIGSGPAAGGSSFSPATGKLAFDAAGNPTATPPDGAINFAPTGVSPLTIAMHFGQVTQLAAPNGSNVAATSQDGMATGVASGVSIDSSGVINQLFSNGSRQPVAQIALASFANPAGLLRAGNTNFASSSASGLVQVGPPGSGQGALYTGVVEQSNVDLSQEFTDLIVTQRAFQANTKVITASSEILQELVNMGH